MYKVILFPKKPRNKLSRLLTDVLIRFYTRHTVGPGAAINRETMKPKKTFVSNILNHP